MLAPTVHHYLVGNSIEPNESSDAFIALRVPLSGNRRARREIQPSNLGGLKENSASTYSRANSLEIDLEDSVEIPLVISSEISSEISLDTESGCAPELPGRLRLPTGNGGLWSATFDVRSTSVGDADAPVSATNLFPLFSDLEFEELGSHGRLSSI
ncbi:hypothetical protein OUZ56_021434 [Daphnia magna]|uniref:Uncharacterized protein n=1 Tax=Daphnia magna TaxID=35525 RepID=A0ABQ9ZHF3_9CRUS|nr:hypothetical protein OUZ56_021434 [Daphnia magna]